MIDINRYHAERVTDRSETAAGLRLREAVKNLHSAVNAVVWAAEDVRNAGLELFLEDADAIDSCRVKLEDV